MRGGAGGGDRFRRRLGRIGALAAGAAVLLLGSPMLDGASDASRPGGEAVATSPTADRTANAVPDVQEEGSTTDGTQAAEQDTVEAAHGEGEGGGGHSLPYAQIFLVLIAILLLGKLFGEAAERIGQPAVLGELLAGVVLGGSVLGIIPPIGTEIGDIVHVFAEIGVAILLFEIGLETDLKEMFRVGRSASAVALAGIVLPFLGGFLYWYYVNPDIGVHPPGIDFWVVAIFVGATLTATSVGITARVLSDLDQMHTSEARIIIGAAVIDDVLGIVILAVVAGLAGGQDIGVLTVGRITLFAVGFLVLAVVIGNRAAPWLFDMVDRMRVRGVLLVSAFCFALLLAALADLSGSAMIIGAFAAGIVLSSTNQFDAVVQRIEPVADIFTPIFFVVVGAPVNVHLFIPGTEDFNLNVLGVGLLLTLIAIIGKVVAGYATPNKELNRLAIGVGMVPRGEVGLIFAALGLSGGILSNAVYSAILIMVILSTFLVPPYLKVLFARGSSGPPTAGSEASAGSGAGHGSGGHGDGGGHG